MKNRNIVILGLFVDQTEAICTGTLAGHNAVRLALGMPLLILPRSMAIGDLIAYANEKATFSFFNMEKDKRNEWNNR